MNKIPIIGITIGDMNSIAPEVVIKTLADNRINELCIPVVYGSPRIISYWKKLAGFPEFQIHIAKDLSQIHTKRSNILVCWEEEVEIKQGEATSEAGSYAFKALEAATKDALEGKIQGLVTAPLNKNTVNSPALSFKGHTEYLAQISGKDALMILSSPEMRVALVTGHLPLKDVSAVITKELIIKKVRMFTESLKNDFGINKPRIAVLGLNPHAGDSGLLGSEEIDIIAPAVAFIQKEVNQLVYGPYPADGFFGSGQHKKFHGVLAMYHDQGLIPFKQEAFHDGVNFTAGLPFVRTSPDHGTAYAMAGKNTASADSMRNAVYAAIDIYAMRTQNAELLANTLPLSPLRRERFRIDF